MKVYWLKIVLGAFAIFAVGMTIAAVGRRSVSKVREAIVNQSVNLGGTGALLRLNGVPFGTVSRVNVEPVSSQGFPRIELAVQLDSTVSASELSDCAFLSPNDEGENLGSEGLRCLDAAEAEGGSYVEIGEVRLEPSGQTLPLYVPKTMLDHKNWFRWFRGRSTSPVAASHGASVQLRADSSKAFMMIRDEHGSPVFQLNADSDGAFIQVRDSNGKEVLRFQADSSGVKGNLQAD